MVISTLFVDYESKTTLPFVQVVGDIRNEVGIATVCFTHDTVFIIAKVSGAQPESASVFVGVTIFNQCLNGFFNLTFGVERGFKEVDVKIDTECLEIKILLVAQISDCKVTNTFEVLSVFGACEALIFRRYGVTTHKALGEINDVLAAVAVFWPACIVRGQALTPRLNRQSKVINLLACIVVVKLTGDVPACRFEEATQAITDGGSTAMANMQRTGRVGRHKFDLHLFALANIRATIFVFLIQNSFDQ